MTTINMHMKFEIEIRKQTRLTLRKPCHLQSPETKKSSMATRQPFWKRRCWKSIGFYPYTWVLCPWSLELIYKAKVKLESGNQKNQYGRQAAILKLMSLTINRLLPMATINKHMKFEIEIPKQTWLMLRKPCRLQRDGRTDGRTDGLTDGWTDKVNPVYPPSNFVGRGYKYFQMYQVVTFLVPKLESIPSRNTVGTWPAQTKVLCDRGYRSNWSAWKSQSYYTYHGNEIWKQFSLTQATSNFFMSAIFLDVFAYAKLLCYMQLFWH